MNRQHFGITTIITGITLAGQQLSPRPTCRPTGNGSFRRFSSWTDTLLRLISRERSGTPQVLVTPWSLPRIGFGTSRKTEIECPRIFSRRWRVAISAATTRDNQRRVAGYVPIWTCLQESGRRCRGRRRTQLPKGSCRGNCARRFSGRYSRGSDARPSRPG